MSAVRHQAIFGLKWVSISQISRICTQMLSVMLLAHLLPPSDYGLAAMATVVIGFASLFRDFGTAAAIIQKNNPNPSLIDSIFWLNVIFGISLAILLGLLAPLIAKGFAESRLREVLWVLLLIFPIASLGTTHQALMEKESHFRPLAIIESVAAFVALAVAVVAAMSNWGVYSLVLQSLLSAFITTAGLWLVSKWRPTWRLDFSELTGLVKFSGNLVGFNVFNYFIRNADNILIGRFLGASDLGYYSMAYRLMLWPLQNISLVIGRVLFPLFSRMQTDQDWIAGAYIQMTMVITLITAPLMFGFFVLREPLVIAVLGSRWLPVSDLLIWLVPVGLLQCIGTSVGSLYLAMGKTDIMLKWGIAAGIVVIPAFFIGLQWGIVGVAAAYCVVSLLLFLPSLAIPFSFVRLKVLSVLLAISPSLLSATIMALLTAWFATLWPMKNSDYIFRLISLVLFGISIYVVTSLITQRLFLLKLMHILKSR